MTPDDEADSSWVDEGETLLRDWCETARDAASKHDEAGRRCKRRHRYWGVPAALLPVVLSPIAAAIDRERVWWFTYAEASALAAVGMCASVLNFYNFASNTERHFSFSNRYMDLVTDIELELSKPRSSRRHADTFLLRCRMTIASLNRAAPDV